MILRISPAAILNATVLAGGTLAVNAAAGDKPDLKAGFLRLGGVFDLVSPSPQLAAFALMSCTERVSPGSVYRTSGHAIAPRQTSH